MKKFRSTMIEYGSTIDELIDELKKYREEYGNINVRVKDEYGSFQNIGYMSVWDNELFIEE